MNEKDLQRPLGWVKDQRKKLANTPLEEIEPTTYQLVEAVEATTLARLRELYEV